MNNDTQIVDRLTRVLVYEGEEGEVCHPAVEGLRRLLAGMSAENAALVERGLARMVQAAEELGPDADVETVRARAHAIRDS